MRNYDATACDLDWCGREENDVCFLAHGTFVLYFFFGMVVSFFIVPPFTMYCTVLFLLMCPFT